MADKTDFVQCNGLVALVSSRSLENTIIPCLDGVRHRSWWGYYVVDPKFGHIGHRRRLREFSSKSLLAGCLGSLEVPNDPQIVFHGSIYNQGSSFFSHLGKALLEGDLHSSASLLANCDGDYCFAVLTDNRLIYARSPMGVKPLYQAGIDGRFGVATERKALKGAKMIDVQPVEPGFLYSFDQGRIEKHPIEHYSKNIRPDEAVAGFEALLIEAVRRRVGNCGSLAIGFSGGIDSALLAQIARRFTKVKLISTFVKGSHDDLYVKQASEEMGLELETCEIATKNLEFLGLQVSRLIESDRPMDISIALPIHLSAMVAAGTGCDSLMLGQLSDELFGGYLRYLNIYEKQGKEEAAKAMEADVRNAHHLNFERDDKAVSPYLNPILPYASVELVENSLRIPISLKIDVQRRIRKLLLREIALRLGLPERIVWRPKKAIQYSSGTHRLIRTD